MKMDFAKVFQLKGGYACQLLVTKENGIQIKFRLGSKKVGVTRSLSLEYETEEERNRIFDGFTQEMAQTLFDTIHKNT